jgi:hypothetical protein
MTPEEIVSSLGTTVERHLAALSALKTVNKTDVNEMLAIEHDEYCKSTARVTVVKWTVLVALIADIALVLAPASQKLGGHFMLFALCAAVILLFDAHIFWFHRDTLESLRYIRVVFALSHVADDRVIPVLIRNTRPYQPILRLKTLAVTRESLAAHLAVRQGGYAVEFDRVTGRRYSSLLRFAYDLPRTEDLPLSLLLLQLPDVATQPETARVLKWLASQKSTRPVRTEMQEAAREARQAAGLQGPIVTTAGHNRQ